MKTLIRWAVLALVLSLVAGIASAATYEELGAAFTNAKIRNRLKVAIVD